MLVVYESTTDEEIIVTTTEQEKAMLREYFGKKPGRKKSDYERSEGKDRNGYSSHAVVITTHVKYEIA